MLHHIPCMMQCDRCIIGQNRGVNVDDMGAGLRQALTRAESLNQSLQKEVNMVRAISKVFFATWRLDLLLDKVTPVVELDGHAFMWRNGALTVKDAINIVIDRATSEYKDVLRDTLRIENLQVKLRHKDTMELEYYTANMGWIRLNIMVVERDTFTDVVSLLFGWQSINEEKWKEKEHKRELEEANSHLLEALAEAKRASEAKSDFLSRMSHDMRTPMNGIIGMANIAMECLDDKERVREALQKIQSASHQLHMLINDVLDMSKIESGKIQLLREHTDLKKIVESLLPGMQTIAKKYDVDVIYKGFQAKHQYIYGSPVHIQRIASNILSNAIKYNREGGTVTIYVTEKPIAGDTEKAMFILTVQDTGMGMSEDFLKNKLFTPFARECSEEKVPGTGLGMAIIKEIVQLMGGEIKVESKLGEGSTFKVYTPMELAPELVESKLKKECDDKNALDGKRILVVDDNDVNLEIATFLLENHGAECLVAHNGRECLDVYLAREAGFFDMILMDVRMPVMNGYETTKAIRATNKADAMTVPIVAMTANAFTEDKRKCWSAGMNDHIAKPIDVEVMLETIGRYIQ